MRGAQRNAACPCGSGLKAKRCGPLNRAHRLTEAELGNLQLAAAQEDGWRFPKPSDRRLGLMAVLVHALRGI